MNWKKATLCSITQFSSNFIDVEVSSPNSPLWRLTGSYGFLGHDPKSRTEVLFTMVSYGGLQQNFEYLGQEGRGGVSTMAITRFPLHRFRLLLVCLAVGGVSLHMGIGKRDR